MGSSLGELQILVLLAALKLGDGAHAVSIAEELREHAGKRVSRATIYVTIRRLEERELVSTHLGEPLPIRGGKARRHVKVRPAGVRAVHDARASINRLAAAMRPLQTGS